MGRNKSMFVVGSALGAMLLVPGVAQAAGNDYGDGSLTCNSGEICFWQNSNAGGGTKQFWQGASHDGYSFSNGTTFKGEASSIKNRDTSCQVSVTEEWDAFENVDTFYFSNSGRTVNFNGDLNDDNGSHSRC